MSVEPILNVYETLATYNGTSNTTYVPVLATCVPGTPQCLSDYGSTLIYQADGSQYTGSAGQPIYWTFVIDGGAKFYDASTGKSWGVYPTDVMFSEAREAAWASIIGVGSTAGWLTTQALLPNGTAWDGGIHAPYNNTPGDILGSMLINDSAYCPAAAMTNEHGCITFHANGGGSDWPFFIQLIDDEFAGAILPCGWYTYEQAGIPGWAGTHAAKGDGPCKVPQLGHSQSTSSAAWADYIGNLTSPLNHNGNTNATSWDNYELSITTTYPAPNPRVQFAAVGSGPYSAKFTPSSNPPGYALTASPAYAQPAGCSGAGGVAKYDYPGTVCYPAAGKYIPKVQVYYEASDSVGISEYRAGQADFAGILPPETGTMLALHAEGKLNYYTAPTISTFFLPINFDWSSASFSSDSLSGSPNIPADFFSGSAARGLLTNTYPYAEAEDTAWTVDNIPYLFEAGGPIAKGMGIDYPANTSFPYRAERACGNAPCTSATVVGGAAWWWAQGTDPSSPYYDPELAACITTTCVFPIVGENGDPGLDTAISEWIPIIESITNNHVQPYSFDLNFGGPGSLIDLQLVAPPGAGPLPVWNLGWAPDNFAPQDYMLPMAFPNSTYTYGDAVAEQLAEGNLAYNDPTSCGHSLATSYNNLEYWSHIAQIPSDCQGVAYWVANTWNGFATHVANPTQQALDYNLVDNILNALNMYIWYGQSTQVTSAAPWISGSSINFNPSIGGGGDQLWFNIQYATGESAVTFQETGLPSGATWSVDATSLSSTLSNTTIVKGTKSAGTIGFEQPNGTISFSISPPAGYGVAAIAGPHTPTYTSANISGSTTLTVKFGKLEPLFFNETAVLPKYPGIPSGSTLTVTLSPSGHGGPPGQVGSVVTSGATGSVEFSVAAGTHYKYHVTPVTDYKTKGGKGSISMPLKPETKDIEFSLYGSKVTFTEHGLPAHSTWGVSYTGPLTGTLSGSTGSLSVTLTNGSYTYTTTAVGALTAPGGGFTVTAPTAVHVTVTYSGQHAELGNAPTRGESGLLSHSNLVATVAGREAA